MKTLKEVIRNLSTKQNRTVRSYTLDPEVVKLFEALCQKHDLVYSQVIEELIREFIKNS